MKIAVLALILLSGSVKGNSRTQGQVTPTQKVIDLLDGMLEKGKKEKHAEEVQFAAYQQFCSDTSAEKKRLIKNAETLINQLDADITKYTADSARLKKETKAHKSDIEGWKAEIEAASKIRKTEKQDYEVKHKDLDESVDALDRALDTLGKEDAADGVSSDGASGGASFLQKSDLSSLKSMTLIPKDAKRAIDAFLSQDPEEGLAVSAPESASYAFQSEGIMKILGGLEDKMKTEKMETENTEMNAQHAYEMMVADLEGQIRQAEQDVDEKTEFDAQTRQKKADAKQQVLDTTKSKQEDTNYEAELTGTCETKATDFASRQKLRAEEIVAIEKAIEILSSDAVAGNAEKHLPSLLQGTSLSQLRSESNSAAQAQAQVHVARFLAKRSKALRSFMLSQLASRASEGPFRKVKKMIQDLITKLKEDAAQEAEHKGFCDEELATNAQTRKEHTASVESLTAEVDELEALIAKLAEEITELQSNIADLASAMEKATTLRNEEKAKNKETIADAKEAAAATEKATEVLKLFYEKAAEKTAFVQQKEPEIFDKPYKGMQSENGGVVGMLEVILSDFERLQTDTETAEEKAQTQYDEFMTESSTDKSAKEADAAHKEKMKEQKTGALTSTKEDLVLSQKELDAALATYDKLKPSCVDPGVDHEDRTARRQQEIESLKEALEILNGKALA